MTGKMHSFVGRRMAEVLACGIVMTRGRYLDVAKGRVLDHQTVLVNNGRIAEISTSGWIKEG